MFFGCCSTELDGSEIPDFEAVEPAQLTSFNRPRYVQCKRQCKRYSEARSGMLGKAYLKMQQDRIWFLQNKEPPNPVVYHQKIRKTWQFAERQQNCPLNAFVPWTMVPRISIRFKTGEVLDEKMAQVWAAKSDCLR